MVPLPFADAPPPDGTLADACGDEPERRSASGCGSRTGNEVARRPRRLADRPAARRRSSSCSSPGSSPGSSGAWSARRSSSWSSSTATPRRGRCRRSAWRRRRRHRRGPPPRRPGRRRSPPSSRRPARSLIWVIAILLVLGELEHRPGPADRRRRDRRRRPRLRRPEPRQGLRRRPVHAHRGPVRHRRRPSTSAWPAAPSSGSRLRTTVAARPGRHGVARAERRDPAGRQPLEAVVGRRARRAVAYDADLGTTREVVHDVAEEVCESERLRRRRAGRAGAARRRGGQRPTAVTLRLLVQDRTRAPSSACSGRCARRSRPASTAGVDVAAAAAAAPTPERAARRTAPGRCRRDRPAPTCRRAMIDAVRGGRSVRRG